MNPNNPASLLSYQVLALWLRLSTGVSTSRGGHLSTGTELRSQTCLALPHQQMSGRQSSVTTNQGQSQTRWEELRLLSNPLGPPVHSLGQYPTDCNSELLIFSRTPLATECLYSGVSSYSTSRKECVYEHGLPARNLFDSVSWNTHPQRLPSK